ncbi:MAG: SDR family NAD(P)-dependent oxidoreductase [Beutenbergiaceae bacterium]
MNTVIDRFNMTGKKAVVTGGSRGIGYACAQALLESGASVVITSRNAEANAAAAQALASAGPGDVHAYTGDISADGQPQQLVEFACERLGGLDVLVNNAGTATHHETFTAPESIWERTYAINVKAVYDTSVAAARVMRDQGGGNIVNMGSISALIVNRPQIQAAYNSSKAAVHQLTKSLAAEWSQYGIRVNAIAPGYVKTEMTPVDTPEFKRQWIDDAPQQRYATPDEIAPTLIYLASEASAFVTGSVLVIDGGYTVY